MPGSGRQRSSKPSDTYANAPMAVTSGSSRGRVVGVWTMFSPAGKAPMLWRALPSTRAMTVSRFVVHVPIASAYTGARNELIS